MGKTLKMFLTFFLLLILFLLLLLGMALFIAFLFLTFWPSVGKVPGKEDRALLAQSKHFYEGEFHNENETGTMTGKPYPASKRRKPENKIASQTPSFSETSDGKELQFTWFGHSSFLLQMGKTRILVDPVLSTRCSPVSFAGPKRFSDIPVSAESLPPVDVLFLSHDHYDHLDYQTIRQIKDKVGCVLVPLGMDQILKGWGVDAKKIQTLDWWESVEVAGVTCTLTPSQHFSGRNPLKRNRTLWGGLYIDNGSYRFYYTGDGGYYDVFTRVRDQLGAPDLMLAECGQYDTAWAKVHMFPEETVQAALDTQAGWLVPIHWGSFCICNHAWDDSIRRASKAAKAAGVRMASPQIGQTVDLAHIARFQQPWWEACK